jgi:hypothetical protein
MLIYVMAIKGTTGVYTSPSKIKVSICPNGGNSPIAPVQENIASGGNGQQAAF